MAEDHPVQPAPLAPLTHQITSFPLDNLPSKHNSISYVGYVSKQDVAWLSADCNGGYGAVHTRKLTWLHILEN